MELYLLLVGIARSDSGTSIRNFDVCPRDVKIEARNHNKVKGRHGSEVIPTVSMEIAKRETNYINQNKTRPLVVLGAQWVFGSVVSWYYLGLLVIQACGRHMA